MLALLTTSFPIRTGGGDRGDEGNKEEHGNKCKDYAAKANKSKRGKSGRAKSSKAFHPKFKTKVMMSSVHSRPPIPDYISKLHGMKNVTGDDGPRGLLCQKRRSFLLYNGN